MKKPLLLAVLLVTPLAAWAQAPPDITFFTSAELRRAIETAPEQPGQPGLYALRLSPASEAEVVGIRRTAPGKAELHASFTDFWYVIDGRATLVTRGQMQDAIQTAPGETRSRGIAGGDSRTIQKGDYLVIPAGTPHWISKVAGEQVLYIVVKVPAQR